MLLPFVWCCKSHTRDCVHHHYIKTHFTFHCFPRSSASSPSSLLPPCSPSQDFGGKSGDAAKAAGAGGGENKDDDAAGALAEASAAAAAADAEKVCTCMYVLCVFSCGKHIVAVAHMRIPVRWGAVASDVQALVGSCTIQRMLCWVHARPNMMHRGARRYLALASSTRLCLLVFPPSSPPRPGSKMFCELCVIGPHSNVRLKRHTPSRPPPHTNALANSPLPSAPFPPLAV